MDITLLIPRLGTPGQRVWAFVDTGAQVFFRFIGTVLLLLIAIGPLLGFLSLTRALVFPLAAGRSAAATAVQRLGQGPSRGL